MRGDDYQYAWAWLRACDALNDPGVESISVEDAGSGQFDDVVTRRRDERADRYDQVKSSNSGDVSIDEDWLTTSATRKGSSPLQHFYRTWKTLRGQSRPFELRLITNRGFDATHQLLGKSRDNYSSRIRIDDVAKATPRTDLGEARDRWSTHLGIDTQELLDFLAVVRWEQAGSEERLREDAKPRMQLAGLRDDDEAVNTGVAIMRELVKTGDGPRGVDELREAVAAKNLLASTAQLVLAVDAIDRPSSPELAHVRLDWVDRFPGDDVRLRYRVEDDTAWTVEFPADLRRARSVLEAYQTQRVFVTGASRLSTHFAIGHELPDVRRWVLAIQQRSEVWTTDAELAANVVVKSSSPRATSRGDELAVVVALSNPVEDLIAPVRRCITDHDLPVGKILVLAPESTPGPDAVASNGWLIAWVRQARDRIRRAAGSATRIHLFMSAPAVAALMLGHQWNTLPAPTTLYDFDRRNYFPTYRLP
ncbi:SAVED domain-containing protein [Kineococcus aurantiacus]|uniref:SMODS-associated and fused to various effectors domain-containing protein n=1 Tax=Kineococcus aurantiacus TaxID=37633 RepID=A0A7Y9DRA1_9ACTN|nr:hypothetical protein [Kineococcus aurantiacus]